MSLLDRYKDFVVRDHCPTIRELAKALECDVGLVAGVVDKLAADGELAGVYEVKSDPGSDVSSDDVEAIIAEVESDLALRGYFSE